MEDKVIYKLKDVQVVEKHFTDEKTGEIVKYYQLYIPELEKYVKLPLVGLEKRALGIK